MAADARELLALLAPHGIEVGRPFGGEPTLTALDIAGAMGMGHVRREMGLLLLAKYAGDATAIPELVQRTVDHVTATAAERAWTSEHLRDRVQAIAEVCVAEAIGANRCGMCSGVGEHCVLGKIVACTHCDGTGVVYLSARRIAEHLGLHVSSYLQTWAPRVDVVRRDLEAWERVGAALVRRGLVDGDPTSQ